MDSRVTAIMAANKVGWKVELRKAFPVMGFRRFSTSHVYSSFVLFCNQLLVTRVVPNLRVQTV